MQIFNNPNYNFVKYRWHAVVVSTIIIAVGLVMFLTRGVNLGIDFAGGASIILKFREQVPLAQLRKEVQGATLQQYGRAQDNSVLIRLPQQKREGDYAGAIVSKLHDDLNRQGEGKVDLNYRGSDQIASLLIQADPDKRGSNPASLDHYRNLARAIISKRSELGIFRNMSEVTSAPGVTTGVAGVLNQQTYLGQFNVLNQETVGPQVGAQLQRKALFAIILSSLAMGLYIWLRFDLVFGIASIVCIIHDVLIALTFLLLLNLEFSLNVVAAILTIVGYSINDTVVMFDRIRENVRKVKKGTLSMADHLNQGINQTLSRTILTSGTVFLVLLAMLVFGGEVIRSFAWILTIGVISGTYSTLYIIPAVVIALDNWRSNRRPVPAAAARVESPRVEPAMGKRRVT